MQPTTRKLIWLGIIYLPVFAFYVLRHILDTSLSLLAFFIACCVALNGSLWHWYGTRKPWWPILMGIGVANTLVAMLIVVR